MFVTCRAPTVPSGPGYLSFLSDMDTLKAYPQARQGLQRGNVQFVATAMANAQMRGGSPPDYTMHGANRLQVYKGLPSEGGRSASSTAVADVSVDVHNLSGHNHSGHSTPLDASQLGKPQFYSDYDSPLVFSSATASEPLQSAA